MPDKPAPPSQDEEFPTQIGSPGKPPRSLPPMPPSAPMSPDDFPTSIGNSPGRLVPPPSLPPRPPKP